MDVDSRHRRIVHSVPAARARGAWPPRIPLHAPTAVRAAQLLPSPMAAAPCAVSPRPVVSPMPRAPRAYASTPRPPPPSLHGHSVAGLMVRLSLNQQLPPSSYTKDRTSNGPREKKSTCMPTLAPYYLGPSYLAGHRIFGLVVRRLVNDLTPLTALALYSFAARTFTF